MKHYTHLLIFAWFFILTIMANAQTSSSTNDRFFKSIYLDMGKTFIFKSPVVGLTYIAPNNWLIASSFRNAEIDAPQKPSDYRPVTTSSGGGGGIIGPIINTNGIGTSGKNGGPQKEYNRIVTLTTGKLFEFSTIDTRARMEGGVIFLNINEAVDFVAVGNGYTYSKEQYNKVGVHAKVGLEFPVIRNLGFGTFLECSFAEGEQLFSLGISLLLGMLY